jgi:hypothetical protein
MATEQIGLRIFDEMGVPRSESPAVIREQEFLFGGLQFSPLADQF